MRRLPFLRHLTAPAIRRASLACRHPVEKVRWHALWLLARSDCPRGPAEVAQLVGLSDLAVRALPRRWNRLGPEGLADRRKGNGRAARLGARRWDALARALARRPPDGGLWTGPTVADPAGRNLLVVLLDNAGWHVAKRLAVPANVLLDRLPPCTPELQPVEPLWPLLREAVANREFERLAQWRRGLRRRCGFLAGHPEIVKGAVGFRWAAHLET